MTGQRDKVYEALLEVIINQLRDRELIKEMHGRICANPPEAQPSKSFMPKGMFAEIGRTLLRVLVPYLTPYILAALTGFGAMIVALWKAFTRGWLGF